MTSRARIGLVLCLWLLLAMQLTGQVFPNGGFEQGDFSDWAVSYDENPPSGSGWSSSLPAGHPPAIIADAATPPLTGGLVDVDPYEGTWIARLNDDQGGKHATRLYTSGTVPSNFNGGMLSFRWAAVLEDPGHPENEQPFLRIRLLINGSESQSLLQSATDPEGWTLLSGTATATYFKEEIWATGLCDVMPGDVIEVEVVIADCAQGAHSAYVFVDDLKLTQRCAPIFGDIFCWAPNAFTPNGDGVNDEWGFRAFSADRYVLRIWDRWGNGNVLISNTSGPIPHDENGEFLPVWDGTFNGGPWTSSAVVVYHLQLINCDTVVNKYGVIALVL